MSIWINIACRTCGFHNRSVIPPLIEPDQKTAQLQCGSCKTFLAEFYLDGKIDEGNGPGVG